MAVVDNRHWTYIRDEDNIIWLTLDRKDATVNTLNAEVLQELEAFLQSLSTLSAKSIPAGLIIQSGKKTGFIAGADVQAFRNIGSPEAAVNLVNLGQRVFAEVAKLPFPTVALIQGFCLGGGLELALACRYRVAVIDPKTQLGLPEVKLGIHPGWGGTVRLPRLVGGLKAMDLIVSGRSIDGKTAQKIGLVDSLVPERQVIIAARYFVQKQPERKTANFFERLTNLDVIRPLVGRGLKQKMAHKINPMHYPAPYAALAHWVEHGVKEDSAFIAEAASISKLILTDTARHLLRVFYLREKLKGLGKEVSFKPEWLHVIGAGVMGGDIAAWCALKGIKVTLQDQNVAAMATALKRALVLFEKHLKEPQLIKAAMDRLIPDTMGAGIQKADLIIEAIVEKREAKQALFSRLATEARSDAIFASNTSTIPLAELSEDEAVQKRLIGLHFFNPVEKMPLVEVITGDYPHSFAEKKGLAFVREIEKLPLPVKSAPGFLVNRILLPYLLESMLLLESGVPGEAIDKTALQFGMPMGPVELADTVGLDVCLYAAENLIHYYGGAISSRLKKLVEEGHLGKKTGQGFYQYRKGKVVYPERNAHYQIPEDVMDRLIYRMLNATVSALREKIVAEADYLDAGMIFGAGFPPFRGGPMQYIAEQGEAVLIQRLNGLAQRYGERFVPDPGWGSFSAV